MRAGARGIFSREESAQAVVGWENNLGLHRGERRGVVVCGEFVPRRGKVAGEEVGDQLDHWGA